jgi:alanyl-tRNA synthetase
MNPNYDDFEQLMCTTKIKDIQDNYYAFEETVFYGEKGGQLADRGTINGFTVRDLKWDGSLLYHKIDGILKNPIKMQVDQRTRYINTAVQSVFHLLDGYYATQGYQLVEVHAGINQQWYEINQTKVSENELEAAEQWMNDVIQQDVHSSFKYVSGNEYPDPNYQKYEQVRLVQFGEINTQPCGTLHVNHTAQIQSFAIIGTEPVSGGTRIRFTTSLNTNLVLKSDEKILNHLSKTLSVKQSEIEERIKAMQAKNRQLVKENKALKEKAIKYQVREISQRSEAIVRLEIDQESDISKLIPVLAKAVDVPKLIMASFKEVTYFGIISPKGTARKVMDQLKERIEINGGGSTKIVTGRTSIREAELAKIYNEIMGNH